MKNLFNLPDFESFDIIFLGAKCTDGSQVVPVINGSRWYISSGKWILSACPGGYYLSSQQCILCPALFYCAGGSVTATPCPSSMFTLPGAVSKSSCVPAVFVIVTVNLPILRPAFSDLERINFQSALASIANLSSGFVVVDIVQSGGDDTSTTITSRIATSDVWAAGTLGENLGAKYVHETLSLHGFYGSALVSLQLTGCTPGFELLPSKTCQRCPSNYFCEGGVLGREPCPSNSFSLPQSNSSISCTPVVFVVIAIYLPMSQSNFTSTAESNFLMALALVSGVSVDLVWIVTLINERREVESKKGLTVNCQIAAENTNSAIKISKALDEYSLNSKLRSFGLPPAVIKAITITGSESGYGDSDAISTIRWVILGSTLGIVFISGVTGLSLYKFLKRKESPEETELSRAVAVLLSRLQVTAQRGYLMSSKGAPRWWRGQAVVFIQRSHAEAAAKMSQIQDFEIGHFDAFCESLEDKETDRIGHHFIRTYSLARTWSQPTKPPQYALLCEWILEVSTMLIKPDLDKSNLSGPAAIMSAGDRFSYFLHRVCRARIWHDNSQLFKDLQVDTD